MKRISWIKDSFSLNHTFFIDGEVVGFIKDSTMSKSTKLSILGRNFVFETQGLFGHTVNMIDLTDKKMIGHIKHSTMWPKATIDLAGTNYNWRRANILTYGWKITDQNDNKILHAGNRKNGEFESEPSEIHILMLAGLFINNRFYKYGM